MQFPHRSSLFRPDNLVLQSLSSKTLLNSPCIVDLAPMLLFLYCLLALMLKTRLSPLIPFFPPFYYFLLDPHFSPSWLYFNSSLNNYGMWLITPTLLQIFNDRALPHLREDKRFTQRINIRKRIWELNSWIKPPFFLDPLLSCGLLNPHLCPCPLYSWHHSLFIKNNNTMLTYYIFGPWPY
jgi:hypothetical protein